MGLTVMPVKFSSRMPRQRVARQNDVAEAVNGTRKLIGV